MKNSAFLIMLIVSTSAFALSDDQAIKKCLSNFKDHPFSVENPKYRTLQASVKVLGFGSDILDDRKTAGPELVLVKTAVNVISKAKFKLLNPKAWYCFGGNISVISKTNIDLHCSAHFTAARDSVVVIGKDENRVKGGVTVIGKTTVNLIDCPKS